MCFFEMYQKVLKITDLKCIVKVLEIKKCHGYREFWTFSVENYRESRVQFLLPISYVPQIEFGIDAMVYRITCRVGLIC